MDHPNRPPLFNSAHPAHVIAVTPDGLKIVPCTDSSL
jgi:hypothetical protein